MRTHLSFAEMSRTSHTIRGERACLGIGSTTSHCSGFLFDMATGHFTLDYRRCNHYSLYTSLIYNSRCPSRFFEGWSILRCSAYLRRQATTNGAYLFVRYPRRPTRVTFRSRVAAFPVTNRKSSSPFVKTVPRPSSQLGSILTVDHNSGHCSFPPQIWVCSIHAGADFTAATATARSVTSSLHSMSRKRGHPSVPAHDERSKRRKPDGYLEVDGRSVAVTSNTSAHGRPGACPIWT